MATEAPMPLLRLIPERDRNREPGRAGFAPPPTAYTTSEQRKRVGPKFSRLTEVLERDPAGLALRADPQALAPERLLVFELRASVSDFARAIRDIPGLDLVDEEELEEDEHDKQPVLYLLVSDARALREIGSLWTRWQSGRPLGRGRTPWARAFELLRNVRPWGAEDRVQPLDRVLLAEELEGLGPEGSLLIETELVHRVAPANAEIEAATVREAVQALGGEIVTAARIEAIAYDAMLARLPSAAVRAILARDGIAQLDAVMHIRPQSTATGIEVADLLRGDAIAQPPPDRPAILALLDGYPQAAHPLLRGRLSVEDLFDLEGEALVTGRVHGTAMASLIIHGDRNESSLPLTRLVHFIPVMRSRGHREEFPDGRLIVDVVYRAVIAMRDGADATAPEVLIVNLSLGNPRRPFAGRISPWARLLDYLAYRYGILFVVSAGNQTSRFEIVSFKGSAQFEDADAPARAREVKQALGGIAADRRIISPAETVNGLTVGACNEDAVPDAHRPVASVNVNPYSGLRTANPSSSLGPGFGNSVKPDILMKGACEHLRVVGTSDGVLVEPCGPTRQHGLKVAAPPSMGREDYEGYTDGTSAAAALVSRTCHLVHDALEFAHQDAFSRLPHVQRAVLLKSLVAHTASWPTDAAQLIRETLGPADGRLHVRQKDNIRRFLGFGISDAALAISCTGDRATFWAVGTIEADRAQTISVPIPQAIAGRSLPHAVTATLAWFTPVNPGRQIYRGVRLRVVKPTDLDTLRIDASSCQPDENQTARGTVFNRRWEGSRAPVVGDNMFMDLVVQRQPDQGTTSDEAVPYGLAVTLTMPGVTEIYEQVRQQLAVRNQLRARTRARA